MHIRKRVASLLIGLLASAGLALGMASSASASNGPAVLVGAHFSNHLAGYAGQGNGLAEYNDVRATVTFPAETGAVPPDTVAAGVALQQYVNGGRVFGVGGVWDDPAGCGAGQWTIEAGTQINTIGSPMPVSTSNLSPLNNGFGDICLPSGQQAVEIYQSTRAHELFFLAGPTGTTEDVLRTVFGVFNRFRDPAAGVTTTSGIAAATLTLGTLADFQTVGLTELVPTGGTKRITFDASNLASYTGTVSGGAPSVLNPVTLGPPSAFGSGSHFVISVP